MSWANAVPMTPIANAGPSKDGLPYATHEGSIEILGCTIRVFQLNDGMRIVNADDVKAFFGGEA